MATAEELIAQAQAASSEADLADIEEEANGRVTVLNAVHARRSELSGSQPVPETKEDAAAAPASGAAVQTVESASENVEPIEQETAEEEAVDTTGRQLPGPGVIGQGNIEKLLASPPPERPIFGGSIAKHQAAMSSPVGQKLAGLIGRPVTDWGVLAQGDVVKGHMYLLDLNSGQKVEAMDGHRINEGELYMNLRNVPEALSQGDTIAKVLG